MSEKNSDTREVSESPGSDGNRTGQEKRKGQKANKYTLGKTLHLSYPTFYPVKLWDLL